MPRKTGPKYSKSSVDVISGFAKNGGGLDRQSTRSVYRAASAKERLKARI